MTLLLLALLLIEDPPTEGQTLASLKGTYVINYVSTPTAIVLNEPFSLDVRIDRKDDAPLTRETLSVDARMPEHRHGMTTQPLVTATGPGAFHVEGMLMHMPGHWELYFDVSLDGRTERARVVLELE